jgi:hypothetical protein
MGAHQSDEDGESATRQALTRTVLTHLRRPRRCNFSRLRVSIVRQGLSDGTDSVATGTSWPSGGTFDRLEESPVLKLARVTSIAIQDAALQDCSGRGFVNPPSDV